MAKTDKAVELLVMALLAGALTMAPTILVRSDTLTLFNRWQEVTFYVLSIVGGGISGALGFHWAAGAREIKRQRLMVWGACLFVFLYVACAALCDRLGVGTVRSDAWRDAGIVLLCAGAALRLWAISVLGPLHSALVTVQPGHKIITSGPYKRVRHPSYLGVLIFLAGVPMVFGAWFPLLAIPGCFVAVKWRIMDEEAFLISEFGEEYESYKRQTWRLIPYLY